MRERRARTPGSPRLGQKWNARTGVPIRSDLVRELARQVDDDELATKLQDAVVRDVKIIALDFPECYRILEALAADCPDELAELRGVLLNELETRRREGLAALCGDGGPEELRPPTDGRDGPRLSQVSHLSDS